MKRDLLASTWPLVVFYCLPTVAIVSGASLDAARPWLWIPAFLVMGGACVANAVECGRVHCFITGPLYLGAAVYEALAAARLAPMSVDVFLGIVVAVTVVAYLLEMPLGRYRQKPSA